MLQGVHGGKVRAVGCLRHASLLLHVVHTLCCAVWVCSRFSAAAAWAGNDAVVRALAWVVHGTRCMGPVLCCAPDMVRLCSCQSTAGLSDAVAAPHIMHAEDGSNGCLLCFVSICDLKGTVPGDMVT